MIATFVDAWRSDHDLEQAQVNAMIQEDAQKNKEFWNALGEEITSIPRVRLITACRKKFHNYERGAWSAEDNALLIQLYEKYPGKWVQIQPLMNRFAEDCRVQWKNYLICGNALTKEKWTKEEEGRLRTAVAECAEVIKEIRQKEGHPAESLSEIEKLVDWQVVSQKMGRTRSRLQCITKYKHLKEREESDGEDEAAVKPIAEAAWRLEIAEFEAGFMTATDKLKLLRAIRDSKAGKEKKIPWELIQKGDLGIQGIRMRLKVAFRAMRHKVPGYKEMKLQAIVEYLIDAYEASAPNEPPGFKKAFRLKELSALSQTPVSPNRRHSKSSKYVIDDDEEEEFEVRTPIPPFVHPE